MIDTNSADITELMQRSVAESGKRSKKKEKILLNEIKNAEAIRKDEDPALQANLFKNTNATKGVVNDGFEGDIVKQKKKKKKVKKDIEETNLDSDQTLDNLKDEKEKPAKKKKVKKKKTVESNDEPLRSTDNRDDRILAITIHRTDKLTTDLYIESPVIRCHVYDLNTQAYVKKENENRQPIIPHDADYFSLKHIPPVTTKEFDLKRHRTIIPIWEECLLIDERYLYFIENDAAKNSPNVIIFFELLDKGGNNAKRNNTLRSIAWAFLKLVGANGALNCEKRLRLQLYFPHGRGRRSEDHLHLYDWWKYRSRNEMPQTTLHVTVKGTNVAPIQRSGQQQIGEGDDETNKSVDELSENGSIAPVWSRSIGQICKIPNKVSLSLKVGSSGCSIVRFSNDGRRVACACCDGKNGNPILIYSIPKGTFIGRLEGHYKLIYDLTWSNADRKLLSASQDGTVRLWNIEHMDSNSVNLSHPTFVYSARFHPKSNFIIVTGSYDAIIRVWMDSGRSQKPPKLVRMLDHHQSYVNCLCFNADGTQMFSCDGLGAVVVWECNVSTNINDHCEYDDWTVSRVIYEPELKGTPISCVQLHGSGKRLLLQCHDNTIRVFDLRLNVIMARYVNAINFKQHLRCTFSPCGTYIFGGSEDSMVYVWNTDSSKLVQKYSDLGYTSVISDISYHPFDHIVAFCAIGQKQPVLIYNYDPNFAKHHLTDVDEEVLPLTNRSGDFTGRSQLGRLKNDVVIRDTVLSKSTLEYSQEILQASRLERTTQQLLSQNMKALVSESRPQLTSTNKSFNADLTFSARADELSGAFPIASSTLKASNQIPTESRESINPGTTNARIRRRKKKRDEESLSGLSEFDSNEVDSIA